MKTTTKANGSAIHSASPLLFVLLSFGAAAMAQEVLTNTAVANMTKAHLGDKVIVEMIQNTPGKYSVTSSALILLKQQGVSDDVIAAMRAKMGRKSDAAPPTPKGAPPAEPRTSNEPAYGKWDIQDSKDEITGESKFEGFMIAKAESNGREGNFEVTATCSTIGLAFKIIYLSAFDKELGYKMSDGNFLLRQPHVVMRLSLDGSAGTAPSTTSNFKNEATLWFQRKMSDEEKKDLFSGVMLGLASLTSPAEPADVYDAKLLKVELPLNNGDFPILEIRPQDPGFRAFASRCNAAEDDRVRKEKEEKAQRDAAAPTAETQRQQAAAAEQMRRQQAAAAAADLRASAAATPPPSPPVQSSNTGKPGVAQLGFVCPGTVIAEPSRPKAGFVIKTPVRLSEVEPTGRAQFKLAGDNKVYFVKSGPRPQRSCSQ